MDHACLHAKLTKHGVESSKTGFHLLNPKMAVKKHQNTIFPAKKTYQTYALLLTDKLKIYYIISLAGATSSLQSENVRQYIHPVPCYIFFLRPMRANPQPSRCRGTRTDTKFGKVSGACNARMKPMFPKLFSAASSQKTTHKGLMAMPYLFLAISMVFQSTWKLKATNLQTKIASKNHIIKSESAQITGARSLSKSHPSRGFSGHGGIFIEETGMVLVTQSKRVRNDASGGD